MEVEQTKMDIEDHLNELFLHYSMELSFIDKEHDTSLSPCGGPMECENEDVFAIAAREMGEEDNNNSKN